DDGETGMLSNYTGEMNALIKSFKDQNDRDGNAYYIFLVHRAENSAKKGYMPRKKQWGFVFTGSHSNKADIMTTIAHELGHGVYRLEHTFSEKGLPQNDTENLMDYGGGRELYKYQWDYVHDPASTVTLFDDEEEGAYVAMSEEEFDYFFAEVEPIMNEEDSEVKSTIRKLKEIYEFFEKCNDENWASYDGQGVIPYCFWRESKSIDIPFSAGVIDGAYLEYEAITQLAPLIEDLRDNISKLIAAYTIDSWRCRDESLVSNATEYERVLQRLKELEGESSIWGWVEEKWQKDSKEDLEDFFKECEEVETLKNDINELYVFITDFEEALDLYFEIESKIKQYLETLQSDENEGYYEIGRLVVPAATVLLDGVVVLSKMAKVKKALKEMKNLINDGEWFKFTNRLDVSSAWKSGWSEERVLNMSKGSRPDPTTYLNADYINGHLAKFDEGAVRFTTQSRINRYNSLGNKEAFTMPKSEFDELLTATGGDLNQIERKLGLNSGDLTGDDVVIAWIRKADISEIKIPSGNEGGVIDEFWIPGGKTSGGITEGIIDLSNPDILFKPYPF
ncbi:MAG: hypothetical protein RJQ14_27740, partial [Marinoscillum sp.]